MLFPPQHLLFSLQRHSQRLSEVRDGPRNIKCPSLNDTWKVWYFHVNILFKNGNIKNTIASRWYLGYTLVFHFISARQTSTCKTWYINTFKCLFLHNPCISPLVPWTSYHGFHETAKDLLLGNNSSKHGKHYPSFILWGALVHSKSVFANQKSWWHQTGACSSQRLSPKE